MHGIQGEKAKLTIQVEAQGLGPLFGSADIANPPMSPKGLASLLGISPRDDATRMIGGSEC